MKCKHCGEEIYKTNICWYHKEKEGSDYLYCKGAPKAEPAEEWVTPTEGPVLPEVEVSNDGIKWVKAKLIRITEDWEYNYPFIVAFERPDNYMHSYAQCRMRKESK
jgi:hypothetical protein